MLTKIINYLTTVFLSVANFLQNIIMLAIQLVVRSKVTSKL